MGTLETVLVDLSTKVDALIAQNKSLQVENEALRNALANGGAENASTSIDQIEIERNIAVPASNLQSIDLQKERLEELVREIDKCIAILNN